MDAKGLTQYANQIYKTTAGLMRMAPEDKINWKPSETNNWMTLGQLLQHLSDSTGMPMRCFVTGEWPPMPADASEMLPPAEKMPTAASVGEAIEKLEADRRVMEQVLADLPDADFRNRMASAPWAPVQLPLWVWLLMMVEHQMNHRTVLFTYLKLLGLPVTTEHMYAS